MNTVNTDLSKRSIKLSKPIDWFTCIPVDSKNRIFECQGIIIIKCFGYNAVVDPTNKKKNHLANMLSPIFSVVRQLLSRQP